MKRKRISPKKVQEICADKDNIVVQEKLPYPIVLYPGHYGTFFAFKHDPEDNDMYLCSCSKVALNNFIYLVKKPENFSEGLDSNHIQNNIIQEYKQHFPISFLDYISSSSGSNYGEKLKNFKGELFKEGLCHSCNRVKPTLTYCHPMYGTKFKRTYGWYVQQKQYEYGIHQGAYGPLYIKSALPNDIKDSVLKRSVLLKKPYDTLGPYQQKEISALYKEIDNYIENSVRDEFSVSLIGQKWKNETALYNYIVSLYGKDRVVFHHRPDWLQGLEIDIFIPHILLGIEYQGIQHYQPLEHWGGEEAFTKLRLHDIKKKNLCTGNNVTLIYFRFDEIIDLRNVKEKLKDYLEDPDVCI